MKKVLNILLIVFMWLISAMFAGSIGVSALSLLSMLDNFTFTPEHIYYLLYLCLTGVIVLLSFIFMIIGIVQSAKKQVFKPMSFTNGLLVLVIIFRLLTVYVLSISDENFKFDLNNYETIIYLIFALVTIFKIKRNPLSSEKESICVDITHSLFAIVFLLVDTKYSQEFMFSVYYLSFAVIVLLYHVLRFLYEHFANVKEVSTLDVNNVEVVCKGKEYTTVKQIKSKSNNKIVDLIFRILTIVALVLFVSDSIYYLLSEKSLISFNNLSIIANLITYLSYIFILNLIGSIIYGIIKLAMGKAKGYSILIEIHTTFINIIMFLMLGVFVNSISLVIYNSEFNTLQPKDVILTIIHLFTFIATLVLSTKFSFKAKNIKAMAENNKYYLVKDEIVGHTIATNVLVVVFSIYYIVTTGITLNIIEIIVTFSFVLSALIMTNVFVKTNQYDTLKIKTADYDNIICNDAVNTLQIQDVIKEEVPVTEEPAEEVVEIEEVPVTEEPAEEVVETEEAPVTEEPAEEVVETEEAPVTEEPAEEVVETEETQVTEEPVEEVVETEEAPVTEEPAEEVVETEEAPVTEEPAEEAVETEEAPVTEEAEEKVVEAEENKKPEILE